MNSEVNKEKSSTEMTPERAAAWLLIDTIYGCIKIAGKAGIPSGHLYAMLMGKVNIETYQLVIHALTVTNKISQDGYVLRAKEAL